MDLDIESIVEPKFSPRPELLLHPTIPKPLHGVNPRSVLGQKWWDVTRKKVYAENNYHCFACGIYRADITPRAVLHAHESYKIDYPEGRVELDRIIALCPDCHNLIHSQRYGCLFDRGDIDLEDAWLLERHRELVLGDLKRIDYIGLVARWEDWHLVIDGKKYYSKFKNEQEWREYYAK